VRSAQQIGRTVSEYHDWQAAERRKHLAAFLSMVRAARDRGEEWVRWIDSGRPSYALDQYAAIERERESRRRQKGSARP